jgi:N-acetylated-alpha-linked acidic dipeptidase
MTSPKKFSAALREPQLPEDSTSGIVENQLPVFNVYSPDGDVRGTLVYVNYGLPQDYEQLEELGIDVKGKIVIARYGGSWRGIKPKVAAERGAIGCLIYSDPRDDGYFQGNVYPKGAWRNADGAQRGSVADMPLYAGDPLTPGRGCHQGREAAASSAKSARLSGFLFYRFPKPTRFPCCVLWTAPLLPHPGVARCR